MAGRVYVGPDGFAQFEGCQGCIFWQDLCPEHGINAKPEPKILIYEYPPRRDSYPDASID